MNNECVIRMAEECEACLVYEPNAKEPYSLAFDVPALKAFADRVITADRENHSRETGAAWALMCEKMVSYEREACAKVCDSLGGPIDPRDPDEVCLAANSLASAIRARGPQ